MGMDMSSGDIRELLSASELRDGEILFKVGEKLEIKGCSFKIKAIYGSPLNEIVLQGQPKILSELEKFVPTITAEEAMREMERNK